MNKGGIYTKMRLETVKTFLVLGQFLVSHKKICVSISIGECAPKVAAQKFGKTSFKYVQLQVHWTNDQKLSNMYDSSGIKLYYTPNLRKYDMGTLVAGQLMLELPPGKKKVFFSIFIFI